MKKRNAAIEATLTLPGITRPAGRPRKPNAMTNAQRQAAYRLRQKAGLISVTRNGNSESEFEARLAREAFAEF
jgi:hypothetical protein